MPAPQQTGETSVAKGNNYSATVLTPHTDFPMRAGLVENEPIMQAAWREKDLYGQIRRARQGAPRWVLHDGPPYANGDIHMGHLLNKVLKDIVVKYKTMKGHDVPFVPGWDCHGLPIEHKVMTELGPEINTLSTLEIRARSRSYAEKYIDTQRTELIRLGTLGRYDRPYITMDPAYEASTLEVFAHIVEAGLVYRQLKPVHWSIACRTALAEAELEYQDRTDTSIFVNFDATPDSRAKLGNFAEGEPVSFMIWTTTPWTLPANMATAVHPDFDYQCVRYVLNGTTRISVVAADLAEDVMRHGGVVSFERLGSFKGRELVGLTYQHPFVNRVCPIVEADYVTLKDEKGAPTGTGLVHTAPGHGAEDFHTGMRFKIPIYSPVKDDGCFDDTVPEFIRGASVWDGNQLINQRLVQTGHMFHLHEFVHSYPHCWRSKTPTIFRCTEQWFIAVDKPIPATGKSLREMAMDCIGKTRWIPEWGESRIEGMLTSRPDWCISRQRLWGLPIPAFYDRAGRQVMTPETIRRVSAHFRKHGSDSWFAHSAAEILGKDCPLPDGATLDELSKENDIFDVWFESGSSWYSVCVAEGYDMPIELYLEGSDQHRGWFQLSMLPSLAVNHRPPFKAVLTHGFVNDDQNRKMSKSEGNIVDPQVEVEKYGADVLRLWVASIDYQDDVRCSDSLIQNLQDGYRKVRNTIRFMLGALSDFDNAKDRADIDGFSIDRWAKMELDAMVREVLGYYEDFAFYKVFRRIHDFCAVEMSSVYCAAIKDRLYCDARDSHCRRRCQTVLFEVTDALIRLLSPILVHTCEEAWSYWSLKITDAPASVHLALMPSAPEAPENTELCEDFDLLLALRDSGMMQLEKLKREAGMTKPLDGEAVYYLGSPWTERLGRYGEDLADLLGVGCYRIVVQQGDPRVEIVNAMDKYARCARCWKRRPDVGRNPQYPDLSARDAEVIAALAASA